ncbi:hypothetical protein PFICI_09456 [Pestalotiopsis fici W106-1]|uniref:ATP-dependent DNA ligase family profile domain-containing protein n=1 Tax=Pestalotiopsis fici (strain W106-1 / CGMCC3.15140) TaxID=1229662 RepID=W3X0D7_PESFW|nr:uncharacterized protein PFICI_09456 [Pestalotiopsis fici W106-1]ETS79603.1 hypothetical protein PFICI_09456 [Pestalotiopsis fici W106-1]
MPFPFRYICDLLQTLHDETRSKRAQKRPDKALVEDWFHKHRKLLDEPSTNGVAVLSTLLPGNRPDRVYGIQVNRLQSIISRAMGLGISRLRVLQEYNTLPSSDKDLADCVEELLTNTPNPKQLEEITVEEIDAALHHVASGCKFSSKEVQASRNKDGQTISLGDFYNRLTARDAKWFTRLVLKDFAPVVMPETVVIKAYDYRLPEALAVREDFATAISLIREGGLASRPENLIKLGCKVARQPWYKAHSIKHCVGMIGTRQVSCEQKIDGEYCQIHIDLSKPRNQELKIYSKSGKESTKDRKNLHPAIRASLNIGKKACPLKQGCILEGELVVYSDRDRKILPFHKIRKHVSRSGAFLGTVGDSQRHDHEHLMIIYYDILMLDGTSFLGMQHSDRFQRLTKLITTRKGHAELIQRQIIDFRRKDAQRLLLAAFAKCIVARGEGLVLKPDDPYFTFGRKKKRYASCAIKLKKAYIKGFGDVGDFAVIGASHDARTAKSSKIENLKYTHFFLACLDNPTEAQARTHKPKYIVTNIVTLNDTQLKYFRQYCNPPMVRPEDHTSSEFDFRGLGNADRPTVIFSDPPVFDIYCFSFDKAPNSAMWTMRFPQVSKIHLDRDFLDVLSFVQLQEAAHDAVEEPEMEDSQEMRLWLAKLEATDPERKCLAYDSQSTVSTISTNQTASVVASTDSEAEGEQVQANPVVRPEDTPAAVAPQRGLITPPRSSATHATAATNVGARGSTAPNTRSSSRKRSSTAVEVTSPSKKPKTNTQNRDIQTTKRKPLGARDANDSQRSTRSGRSVSPPLSIGELEATPPVEGHFPSSVTGSFYTANEPPSSPSGRTPRKGRNAVGNGTMSKDESQVVERCRHVASKKRCAFKGCAFLLSPCIREYAWIDDLLKGHGIFGFQTIPEVWARQASSRSSSAASTPRSGSPTPGSINSATKRREQRLCLVDSRRADATRDFIKAIEVAGLTCRNGEREWISVYDWRILEDITSMESRAYRKGGPDPWRARYLGLA